MADNETETITIEVRKDFDPGLRAALVSQLQRGTGAVAHPVVGNFADLQRAGAVVVAAGEGGRDTGNGFAAGVTLNPSVDPDDAKAGAERTLREEAEAKTPAEAPEPPVDEDAQESVDPTSTSPEVAASGGRRGRR